MEKDEHCWGQDSGRQLNSAGIEPSVPGTLTGQEVEKSLIFGPWISYIPTFPSQTFNSPLGNSCGWRPSSALLSFFSEGRRYSHITIPECNIVQLCKRNGHSVQNVQCHISVWARGSFWGLLWQDEQGKGSYFSEKERRTNRKLQRLFCFPELRLLS